MQIGNMDRIRLGLFPTPLQELTQLAKHLGGPRIFIKRDDMNGLGLGGNKLRKLEYAFAEAQSQGATTVITIGGLQSNHVRLTTAAANRLGMKTVLILRGAKPERPSGNLLVDEMLGPEEIHYVDIDGHPEKGEWDEVSAQKAEKVAERLRAAGETPFIIPNGCAAFHGALGYSGCVLEIVAQLREQGLAPTKIVAAIGTSSMLTGLLLGTHLYTHGEAEVLGISVVSTPKDELTAKICGQLDEANRRLALSHPVPHEAVRVLDAYVGEGYGIPSDATYEALVLLARSEGLVLDPVYTGKTMAGLIDLTQRGELAADDVVVFIHTGGIPGLFADEKTAGVAGYLESAA